MDDLRVEDWVNVVALDDTPCGPTTSGLKEESSGDTLSWKELVLSSSAGFLSVNADSLSSDLLSLPMLFRHDEALPKDCDMRLDWNAGRVIVRIFFASSSDEVSGLRGLFSARYSVSRVREIEEGDHTTATPRGMRCCWAIFRD